MQGTSRKTTIRRKATKEMTDNVTVVEEETMEVVGVEEVVAGDTVTVPEAAEEVAVVKEETGDKDKNGKI